VLSGFAMRKPPSDWERLRSWSIASLRSGWRTAHCRLRNWYGSTGQRNYSVSDLAFGLTRRTSHCQTCPRGEDLGLLWGRRQGPGALKATILNSLGGGCTGLQRCERGLVQSAGGANLNRGAPSQEFGCGRQSNARI
jgi:hypothetical protein